jgi:hypothetical protein
LSTLSKISILINTSIYRCNPWALGRDKGVTKQI